jgi:pimeloyl-ACP methyl ester carboxylesterase
MRRLRQARSAAAAVCTAGGLLLAGCFAAPPAEGPTELSRYLSQEADWQDCPDRDEFLDEIPGQAQCATVEVPVDYFDNTSGRGSLEIALIRIPAAGQSVGSMLINPGGPGASGFDQVAFAAEDLQRSLPGYDIVGFDPRGVGRSAGFDCGTSTEERRSVIELDFSPEDPAEFQETYQQNMAYEQSCRDANAAWGFLGTQSVARDIAVISQVLGDEGINYYGISYGSVIGYELLRTFGDRIDRMILESPVDPSVSELLADQLAAFNTKIEELLVLCASREYLYCGAGRTAEQVRADFIAALEDIENPDYTSLTRNGAPSEALVYYGMLLPLYLEWNDEYTKMYLDAVHALINTGSASNFERWGYLYHGYDPTQREFLQSDDIQELVLCLDESPPLTDTAIAEERRKDQAELAAIRERAPLLYAVGFSGAYLDDDRAYWPCSYAQEAFADASIPDPLPEPAPVTNAADVPVLVLGVSGDTATPYAWSRTVAADLGVPLVTQDTTGHGVYTASDNDCTRDLVVEYLDSGTLPDSDVTC